ncbi:MAG: DUF5320 domain-containing protein [Spirochaetaceae bacterium]|nr:DUF5320 domain-containing protein [Spirochaetaceae bacterium]
MKGNGKGPENKGPKTGRGLGFCYGWGKPGYTNDDIAGAAPRKRNRLGYDHRKK